MTTRGPDHHQRRGPASARGIVPNAPSLEEELDHLGRLGVDDLRARWRKRFRDAPPPALPRDLLARLFASRLQEKNRGGLDAATRKLLARLAGGTRAPVRRLKVGSVLGRDYQGIRHEVTVLADGFAWRGARYASLSVIARAITGTPWNGPRFFGLRDKATASRGGGGEEARKEKPGKSPRPGMSGTVRPNQRAMAPPMTMDRPNVSSLLPGEETPA